MKIPSERRTSDAHYSPYTHTSGHSHSPHNHHSHHEFQPPLPPLRNDSSASNSRGTNKKGSNTGKDDQDTPGSGSGGAGTQYKVARAISSCTRCRSRKQKCDGKLPACSACERAKVECIGFDAISKTNISRNYLHSLEQEVASLRAQVASLTDDRHDEIGQVKRGIAANASQAVSSFAPSLTIDPSLSSMQSDSSEPLRSPWDSPGFQAQRRHTEHSFPPTPLGAGNGVSLASGTGPGGESPRSPYLSNLSKPPLPHSTASATSLTRLVHDAAYRTGHAQNPSLSTMANAGASSVTGSDKGSVESPAASAAISTSGGGHDQDQAGDSSGDLPTPISGPRRAPSASPITGSGQLQLRQQPKKRPFAIPPLPPQPAVERLVAAYVDFVGVTAPMVHIPTLGKQLIKIREQSKDVEEGDIFVVMMVLALSTMASSRFVDPPDELRACSEAFHAEAMKHLDAVFEEQTYVGLQAILLLVWYSLLNPDKGSIWFLVGLACRTCVDLGFHNERNAQKDQLDNLEVDMRRRLFWCTYKMDRLLSTSLGRPNSIPDGFINVPYPSEVHDVDIHAGSFGPVTGEICAYKSVFMHTLQLRRLQSRILWHTYGVYLDERKKSPSPEWFDDMFEQLKQWLATTPEPRGTVSSEGFAISFHNSVLLLFRPSPGNPRPGKKALQTVLASSSYIIRIYRRMQLNNRISWLWMTSHFSFMAGVSFLYAFFNLYHMSGVEEVPTLEDAQLDLESCQAVLAYLAPRVPSAAACHDTMQTLSKAIMDQLASSGPPHKTGTSPGRSIRSCAPVSSSRHDPLPNDRFPAPLPPVPLPYELSLLDNVFINPMAAHSKASDYTNGKQARLNKQRSSENANAQNSNSNLPHALFPTFDAPPQGFPPNAFGGTVGYNPGNNNSTPVMRDQSQALTGLNPYGIAAQVNQVNNSDTKVFPFSTNTTNNNNNSSTWDKPLGDLGNNTDSNMSNSVETGTGAGGPADPNGFDILNFLMDEEGGLGGTSTWDALDVPADFSLWS